MAIPSWNRNASSTDLEILTAEGLDLSGTIRQSEVVYGSARYSETRTQDISIQDVVDGASVQYVLVRDNICGRRTMDAKDAVGPSWPQEEGWV